MRIQSLYSQWETEGDKFVSEWQTVEQIVVPMLFCMGWGTSECGSHGISLIRTGATKDFDLLFLDISNQTIYMGVECKSMETRLSKKKNVKSTESPSNDSFPEQIIRYKTESNIVLRGTKKGRFHFDPSAKFVWTNGVEWIVFKEAAFTRTACQKQSISDLFAVGEGDSYERYFMRFSFPKMRENLWDVQFENLSRELAPEWGCRTAARR